MVESGDPTIGRERTIRSFESSFGGRLRALHDRGLVGDNPPPILPRSERFGKQRLPLLHPSRARARRRRFQRAVRPSCAEQTDRLEPALRLLVDVAISF
jgi:hypothetical protein